MALDIPEPGNDSFGGWAAAMARTFPDDELYNFVSLPWQEWAKQLFFRPSFASVDVPDPRPFQDWRAWANALRLAAS